MRRKTKDIFRFSDNAGVIPILHGVSWDYGT